MNEKLMDQCRMFLAAPPYNDAYNYARGDGYLIVSLNHEFGEEAVKAALKAVKEEMREAAR